MQALRRLLTGIVANIGAVAGLWFVVAYTLGYVVLTPQFLVESGKARGFFDDYTTVKFGSWALLVSIAGLAWFLAGLSEDLHALGEARLGRVALGGGLVGAAATVAGAAAYWIGTSRLEQAEAGIGVDLTTIHDLGTSLLLVAAPVGFGVTVLAVAAAGARSAHVPPALTLVSAGLALALWVPWIARFVLALWLVWVLLVALVLQRRWADEAARPSA